MTDFTDEQIERYSRDIMLPEVGANLLGGAIGVAIAIFAKQIYVDHALRCFRKIKERNLSSTERDAYLERAGGVSIPGAVLGSIILISLQVLSILAKQ